jgi:hypothetical protein
MKGRGSINDVLHIVKPLIKVLQFKTTPHLSLVLSQQSQC